MEAQKDQNWLSGNPKWWGIEKTSPPDYIKGELSPPETWISSSPRIGKFGWIRQRYKPLVWTLLRPLAWSPFFLIITIIPLIFPGQTPNDRLFSIVFFTIAWCLVFFPLIFSRNNQPMSQNNILTLPIDWLFFTLGLVFFVSHILIDQRFGWISYLFFWISYIRTILNIQSIILVPPARFLLPIISKDWTGNLEHPWKIDSISWSKKILARASSIDGELIIAGISRKGTEFLSLAYLHKSGFIQDPFHYNHEKDRNLEKILSDPPSIIGIEWPTDFIHYNEEE